MSISTLRMRLCCVLSCLLLVGPLHMAIAAPLLTFNPDDQDLIHDLQNRLQEEQQRRLEELKDLPAASTSPPA
ncbi:MULTISPECIES: hypothetical protein [Pseudomonas]|uniref:hypothetical protein n=1 Tax=Pseudomonas TaxID=286 RepID=UPI0005FC3B28|nr:hypothetical protein CW358_08715 [Pseudomonas protegens]BAQ81776.1 hemolysin secretion/activation protein, ShlB family [Pseudomonas sp. St29]